MLGSKRTHSSHDYAARFIAKPFVGPPYRCYNVPTMTNSSYRNAELLICNRCGRPHDGDDRFCRKCGSSLPSSNRLPATRGNYQPVVWRSPLPTITRGVTAVVIGTLAEIALKRLVKSAVRPGSLLPALRRNPKPAVAKRGDDAVEPDAVIESEAFMVRRVWIRRGRQ